MLRNRLQLQRGEQGERAVRDTGPLIPRGEGPARGTSWGVREKPARPAGALPQPLAPRVAGPASLEGKTIKFGEHLQMKSTL